jgi:hypothetical protein
MDLEAGEVIHSVKDAHSSPLFSMHVLSEKLVATGDDKGCIKVSMLTTVHIIEQLIFPCLAYYINESWDGKL